MLKKLLSLLLLTSCSISSVHQSDKTLAPLPTTGVFISRSSHHLIVSPTAIETFLDNFYRNYTGFKSMPRDQIVSWARFWCNGLRDGMSPRDITASIRQSDASPQERTMMNAIFVNAMLDLCPAT